MIADREIRYLRDLGFQYLGESEGINRVRPNGEPTDESWMLAYHLLEGRVRLERTGDAAPRARGATPDSQEIEDLADGILEGAVSGRASDIHLEPTEKSLRVRYRLDGRLVAKGEIPLARRDHLVAHLKIRAGMDIAEKRRPQDGRVHYHGTHKSVDMRVSTLPTQYGEKMVLRLLDKADLSLELDHLGLPEDALPTVKKVIGAPYGMALVTGPTGSGKTTTLYSCLTHIQGEALNIMTIEDPIEYRLEGVNQTQVNPDIGVTFASTLRTFLRQDPNVIMVGEIRDEETAELATRAALTGHLVLSTLHTNDAVGAIPRLTEMGVQSNLLGACLHLVIAQRLVRRLCTSCRGAARRDERLAQLFPERVELRARAPVGCEACLGTGYKGRCGIYEILSVDAALRALINQGAGVDLLRQQARASGMRLLAEEALHFLSDGTTSLEEITKEAVL